MLAPVRVAPVHAELPSRRPASSTSRTGIRTSTSRWTSRRRSPSRATPTSTKSATSFYELPPSRGHPLQPWASRFGFGAPTGIDIGPESAGPPADARVAAARPTRRRRTRQVDRIWKPGDSVQLAIGQGDLHGDAAADGALLRDDRERRQARHAARRRGRRAADERPAQPQVLEQLRAAQPTPDRRRPDGAAGRPGRALARRRTRRSAPRTASSASSRSRSPARRDRAEGRARCPATRTPSS